MFDAKLVRSIPVLILLLALAGCDGDGGDADTDQQAAADAAPPATDAWAPVSGADAVPDRDYADPEAHTHPEGRFRVYWPSHCAHFSSNKQEDPEHEGELKMVQAMGTYEKDPQCGASVAVYFRGDDGGAATPESISRNLSMLLRDHGLEILHQRAVTRLGMQGVVANCREPKSNMLYWVEAYLYKGRTLLVMAWDRGDFMYEDPELLRFFRSVEFVD